MTSSAKYSSKSPPLAWEAMHNKVYNQSLNLRQVFFLIGIHSMQGWTATTRHGVTGKEAQKRLHDTENLFRKNLQLKDVC